MKRTRRPQNVTERAWFHKSYTVDTTTGCWLWNKCTKGGKFNYGIFSMNGVGIRAHRASYMLNVGPIPDGFCVCHQCDTPMCVNPEHLFIGTDRDNAMDAVSKHRMHIPTPTGFHYGGNHWTQRNPSKHCECSSGCKLTTDQVKHIREQAIHGLTISDKKRIAREHGITDGSLWLILTNRTWKHVTVL
jgi:hypothetical protein